MRIAKRIFLFFAVNMLIVLTISLITSLLGLRPYLTQFGLDYGSLAGFCLIWGFGGAFISLALSKVMAKWMMGVKLVDSQNRDPEMRWLLDTVHRLARKANLPKMPEVGFYESDEVNAFATGPSKGNSLVAVSTGLLRRMDQRSVEGVLGHEVAHIANGDMVTMTLLQGVVNAFVMFFARVVAWALSQNVDEEKRGIVNFFSVFVFEIIFGLLGMMVVAAFSRQREFRADKGGAQLAGRDSMVSALQGLQRVTQLIETDNQSMAALKISNRRGGGLMSLLSTHPSLEDRIQRLQSVKLY